MIADNFLRLNPPQHFPVACQKPFFLIAAVVVCRCHVGRYGNNASFFDSREAEIKRRRIAPVNGWDNMQSLRCSVCAAPAVAEHVVQLQNRRHFQIHAEIRREYRAVRTKLIQYRVWLFPYPFKPVIVEKEMHHTFLVFLVVCAGFVEADQKQIVKVSGLFLKFRNDRDVPSSVPRKLIAQHDLACPVVVVFFRHNMPPVCKIIASTYSGKYEKSCMCLYNTDKKKDRNRNLFRSVLSLHYR